MADIKGVVTMEFNKTGETSWKSEGYTIRFYEYTPKDRHGYENNPHYRAYLHGYSFDGRKEYLTLISAIQACNEHNDKEEKR